MIERLSWKDKYSLCLNDNLSIRDIMKLFECGQPKAATIRSESIRVCDENKILRIGKTVPTDIVLRLVGRNRDYYYQRMLDERKLKNDNDRS